MSGVKLSRYTSYIWTQFIAEVDISQIKLGKRGNEKMGNRGKEKRENKENKNRTARKNEGKREKERGFNNVN